MRDAVLERGARPEAVERLVRMWRAGTIRTADLSLAEQEAVHVRVMELAVEESRLVQELAESEGELTRLRIKYPQGKVCGHCQDRGRQPRTAFYRDGRRTDGLDSWCIRCRTAYNQTARERRRAVERQSS
jgi:hypothetical protein